MQIATVAISFILFASVTFAAPPEPRPTPALAAGDPAGKDKNQSPMQWTAKKTKWDRKHNRVYLEGTAAVHQVGESVFADRITIETDHRIVDAFGNCVYVQGTTVMRSQEMHLDFKNRTGFIKAGQVANDAFLLNGDNIERIDETHLKLSNAEYTTCKDCPATWSFLSEKVDLEVDEYAFMKNVVAKVNDTPFLWLPYMVIPLKTKRQSGFLFPKFGVSSLLGTQFVQPFFWATSRSTDMTFGAGVYGSRGLRFEWEGRYAIKNGSATARYFLTGDRLGEMYYNWDGVRDNGKRVNRYAFNIQQQQVFSGLGVTEKLRFFEVSDGRYPIAFNGKEVDVPGLYEPTLKSDFSLSKSTKDFSTFIEGRRYRDLLNIDDPTRFNTKTVQLAPRLQLAANDRLIGNLPIATGLTLGMSEFTRPETPFDYDSSSLEGAAFRPGIDPIRRARRFSYTPSIYTTLKPGEVFSVVPSVQYRGFYYNFPGQVDPLSRGYLLGQTEMSVQWSKIYDTNDPEIPRVKHVIRPMINYSVIPYFQQTDNHPFINQIESKNGYNFDNQDIVPIGGSPSLVNYFTPLGHSVSYSLLNQVIRRRGAVDNDNATQQNFAELNQGQTLNLREFSKSPENWVPLSRFFSFLTLNFDKLKVRSEYYYYPYLSRIWPVGSVEEVASPSEVSTSVSYILEKSKKNRLMDYERSFSIGHAFNSGLHMNHSFNGGALFSINDYFTPSFNIAVNLRNLGSSTSLIQSVSGGLVFNSPSQCWKVDLSSGWSLNQGTLFNFNFAFNFAGTGYSGITGM